MATHFSILVWRIPWAEEHGGLQSMGLQRVRHNWMTNTFTFILRIDKIILLKFSKHPLPTTYHLPISYKIKHFKIYIYIWNFIYMWNSLIWHCAILCYNIVKIQCQIKEFLRKVWEEKRGKINMKESNFPSKRDLRKCLRFLSQLLQSL